MRRGIENSQELNRARRNEPVDLIPCCGSLRGSAGQKIVRIQELTKDEQHKLKTAIKKTDYKKNDSR